MFVCVHLRSYFFMRKQSTTYLFHHACGLMIRDSSDEFVDEKHIREYETVSMSVNTCVGTSNQVYLT